MVKIEKTSSKIYLLLLSLLAIGIVIFLSINDFFSTNTIFEKHFITLDNFHQTLLSGNFFPKWASQFGNGYGYPLFIFRPPLIYWIQEIFKLYFINPLISSKILLTSSFILSIILFFYFSSFLCEKRGAFVSSILFLTSPSMIDVVLCKKNFDEILSIFLFPLSLFFLTKLLLVNEAKDRERFFFPLTFSSTLLAISNTASLFSVLSLFVWTAIIVSVKKESIKNRNPFFAIISLITSIAVSSFYWLPALVEKKFIKDGNIIVSSMLSQIGILLTLFASLTIAISIIQKRNEDRALLSLSLLSVSIILLDKTIPNLIDNMIVKNSFVQFFFIPLLSILCGRFFNKEKKFTIPMILATILAITTASMHIINTPSKIEQSKIDDSNAIFYSLWQEYMPVYVKIIPKEKYDRPFGSLSGNIKLLREEFSPERRGIRVKAKKGGETIRLNIFYFPGWTVNIKESKIPIRIDDSGRMIAVIPEGVHFIKVFLSDTKIEKAAHIISYIALIFLFFIYIFKERFFLI